MNIQVIFLLLTTVLSFGTALFIMLLGNSALAIGSAFITGVTTLFSLFLYFRSSKKIAAASLEDFSAVTNIPSLPDLLSSLTFLLENSTDDIRTVREYPLIKQILASTTTFELEKLISLAKEQLGNAEKILAVLSDRVLTDCQILLPLANSIIKAVPSKTEEAAFVLMEKFLAVREAASKAEASARALRNEIEDTQSLKSINYTAEVSRSAVRTERESIKSLSSATRENREHLKSMSREIEIGLDLLNNITEITEQSKLIAFNMSIEAARMGEKGRGVKVITTELHKLNDRTYDFSHQVADLLGRFRDYNTLLVTNMEEKSSVVVSQVEKGIDAMESALESLIAAASHAGIFTREIAEMSEQINHGLDGVLESLQFQDITRQMIEGSQAILQELKVSLDECIAGQEIPINESVKHERFLTIRERLIAGSKTKYEKTALMEVQL